MVMTIKRPYKHIWTILLIILITASIVAGLFLFNTQPVNASILNDDGPERKALISVSYTTYEWWLLSWSNTEVLCQVLIEHEGLPEYEEVKYYCGLQLAEDWQNTQPCRFSDEITKADQCPGLYFHLASTTPGEREIEVDLLPPEVFIDIAGCTLQPPENRCNALPELHLIAEEPLPNETIINLSLIHI